MLNVVPPNHGAARPLTHHLSHLTCYHYNRQLRGFMITIKEGNIMEDHEPLKRLFDKVRHSHVLTP